MANCCTCFGTHNTLNSNCNPPSSKCGDCLILGNITKTGCAMNLCEDVDTLEIDFSCFCFPCTTPIFTITNTSELTNIEIVSIDKTKLVIQSTGVGYIAKQTIKFTAQCGEGCDVKSDYGTVDIHFRSACFGIEVPGMDCDPCTGELTPGEVDIVVTSGNGSSGVDLQIT